MEYLKHLLLLLDEWNLKESSLYEVVYQQESDFMNESERLRAKDFLNRDYDDVTKVQLNLNLNLVDLSHDLVKSYVLSNKDLKLIIKKK